MIQLRKIIVLILGILVCALLVSCWTETDDYINEYVYDNDYITDETEANDYTITPYPIQPSFTGEPVHRDYLLWPEGRDRDWEQDIRHIAVIALRQHPLLIGFDSWRFPATVNADELNATFNVALLRVADRHGIAADDSAGMSDELRALFIDRVNTLINNIPELSDLEVNYGLAGILALLSDAHSAVAVPMDEVFPAQLISLYDGIYFIGVPVGMERALYGQLIAINGASTNEIIESLAKIISHENTYNLRNTAARHFLTVREFLSYINVVCDYGMADFTVRGICGETFDISLQAVDRNTFNNMLDTEFVRHEFNTLTHMHPEDAFWHEFFIEYNMLYIRSSSFSERYRAASQATIRDLMDELKNWPIDEKIETVVIDLRQNGGGVFVWPEISDISILSEVANSVYVLIDNATFSNGVTAASNVVNHMENVMVTGEPTGQWENFFGGPIGFLPNSGLRYQMSMSMRVQSSIDDVALRPDIFFL